MIRTFIVTLVAAGCAAPAFARQPAPETGAQGFQIGPFNVRPRLDIREIGVDDNVFNDPDDPQSDFTATISPRLDITMRAGWTRLITGTTVDFVYFQDFEEERSVNRAFEGRFELYEGLLRPYILGSAIDTHERVNAEIDARAQRRQTTYGGGLGVALTPRTILTAGVRRFETDFADDERYRGVDLSRTLNLHSDLFETSVRTTITPLTTWHLSAGVQRDRFDYEPRRDSDSIRITTGFEFSPSALISGSASLGYRRFAPLSDALAEYHGPVAQAGLAYTTEALRLEGQLERDVRYSYEEFNPYYVTTGGRLVVTQRVAGPVDVQGTVGRQNMAYRQFGGGEDESRRDWTTTYGGGVGYRLGLNARVGGNIEWSRRRSDTRPNRGYDRRRLYGSLTYGF